MAIPKIKHGQDITSAVLNNIIDIVNNLELELQESEGWNDTVQETIEGFKTELLAVTERYDEKINALPNLQELITTFIEAKKSGVIWTDGAFDNVNNLMLALAELELYEPSEAAVQEALDAYVAGLTTFSDKLQIFRGTHAEVLTRPIINKQILFDTEFGGIYVDEITLGGTTKRIAYGGTASGEALIPPTIAIVFDDITQEYVWEVTSGGVTTRYTDVPVRGQQGTSGNIGPIGPKGTKGNTGERGPLGQQGPKGEDGASTLVSIRYSDYSTGANSTSIYINQKYMGLKVYTDKMTPDEIAAQPTQWIDIKGKTFYPHVNPATGLLTWSEEYDETVYGNGINIRGPQGIPGPQGPMPYIVFSSNEDPVPIVPEVIEINGQTTYKFTPAAFKGDKGDKGDTGPQGEAGAKGDEPKIHIIAATSLNGEVSIAKQENAEIGGILYDYVFTMYLPKGEKGDDGVRVDSALVIGDNLRLYLSDATYIDAGNVRGPKGDNGLPTNLSSVAITMLAEGATPLGSFELVHASTNTYRLNISIPRGQTGATGPKGDTGNVPTISGVTVSTVAAGSQASANLVALGNDEYRLDLYIPKGDTGSVGPQGPQGQQGPKGEDGKSVNIVASLAAHTDLPSSGQTQNDAYLIGGYLWVYTGASTTGIPPAVGSVYNGFVNVGLIQGPQGEPGADGAAGANGKKLLIQNNSTAEYLQYKYEGDAVWTNLISYVALKGPKGDKGNPGATGADGADGDPIVIQKTETHVQWKYGSEVNWTNLIPLTNITGPEGAEVQLQKSATHIQWKRTDEATWVDLVALADLKGDTGAPGTNGTNGIDGKTILTGNTAPNGALGVVGDLYLDLVTFILYLKTAISTWTNKGSLKGLDGANGVDGVDGTNSANGAKWYYNSGAPTVTPPTGAVNDDWYLDYSTYNLYCLTNSIWTLVGNIKGANGADGATGTRGTKIYFNDSIDPSQVNGAPTTGLLEGDIYISKTDFSLWRYSIVWSFIGAIKGADGEDAAAGADGKTWYSGTTVPDTTLGVIGDWYLRTSGFVIYTKTGAITWTVIGTLNGSISLYGTLIGSYVSGQTYSFSSNILSITVTIASVVAAHTITPKVGDTYFNTTTKKRYQVTTVTSTDVTYRQLGGYNQTKFGTAIDSTSESAFTAPTSITADYFSLGDIYINTTTGYIYECTGVTSRTGVIFTRRYAPTGKIKIGSTWYTATLNGTTLTLSSS